MFFNFAAFGLALAWLATVWATARPGGSPGVGCRAGGRFTAADLSDFHQFRCAGNGFRDESGCWRWARRKPVLAGVLIGLGAAREAVSVAVPGSVAAAGYPHRTATGCGSAPRWPPGLIWLVVNLPVMVLFPRGWSEFFRLNTRRGDDMDSLFNVVKSFTGWQGFDPKLGFWQPPTVTQHRRRGAVRVVLRRQSHTSR